MPSGTAPRLVFTSSVGLCRDLVDFYQGPATNARPGQNSGVVLVAETAARLLESNRELLQARSIQEGKSIEQSAHEFDLLLQGIRLLDRIRLETCLQKDRYELQVEVSWK